MIDYGFKRTCPWCPAELILSRWPRGIEGYDYRLSCAGCRWKVDLFVDVLVLIREDAVQQQIDAILGKEVLLARRGVHADGPQVLPSLPTGEKGDERAQEQSGTGREVGEAEGRGACLAIDQAAGTDGDGRGCAASQADGGPGRDHRVRASGDQEDTGSPGGQEE